MAKKAPVGRGGFLALTVSCEKGDGRPLGTGATSSPNAVDVVLRVIGIVIVEHMSDVAHVLISG